MSLRPGWEGTGEEEQRKCRPGLDSWRRNVDGESDDYDASKLATGGPPGYAHRGRDLNYRLNLFDSWLSGAGCGRPSL